MVELLKPSRQIIKALGKSFYTKKKKKQITVPKTATGAQVEQIIVTGNSLGQGIRQVGYVPLVEMLAHVVVRKGF